MLKILFAGEWGKNAQEWLSHEMYFVAIAIVGIAVLPQLLKKEWARLAVTLFCSGIVIFFIANADYLEKIAKVVADILLGDDA